MQTSPIWQQNLRKAFGIIQSEQAESNDKVENAERLAEPNGEKPPMQEVQPSKWIMCPVCGGSEAVQVMHSSGPNSCESSKCCPECYGTGGIDAARLSEILAECKTMRVELEALKSQKPMVKIWFWNRNGDAYDKIDFRWIGPSIPTGEYHAYLAPVSDQDKLQNPSIWKLAECAVK